MKKLNIRKWLWAIAIFLVVLYTNKMNTVLATTALPSRIYVETPSINQSINGTNFDVKGWSLSATGIKQVKIYIDNVYRANATIGLVRSDVNAKYPGYVNESKSGFIYRVNVNYIKAGKHIISVYSYGNNGTIKKYNVNIKINKKPVRGWIDLPTNKQVVTGYNLNVTGWILNPSGVTKVQIYIDNKFKSNTSYGKNGYSYNVDVRAMHTGTHKISVISTGNDGSKLQNDRIIIIKRKAPKMMVETPISNSTTTQKDINIKGWALNDSEIKVIQYYLNGKLVGTSSAGITRSTVNSAYPGYLNGKNSGFLFSFNALRLVPIGTKKALLKVVAVGKDGTSSTSSRYIILKKLPEKLRIETPLNNSIIKNNIMIAGWALNSSGVSSVKIYLDNALKSNSIYGSDRKDVNAAYPGYTNGDKSGLSYQLDITKTTPGNHTIRVDMVGNDGRKISQSVVIKVYGIVEYHNYNITIDKMVSIQFNLHAVYQNTKTWIWGVASSSMIKGFVNPLNIINDAYRKYELLKLSYNAGVSVWDLNKTLSGKGVLDGKGQAFIDSAKSNNINPIYLISHAILETGNGTSTLANGIIVTSVDGKAVTPRVVYNLFGIGAYDSNANKYGSEYAYKQGWFSIGAAINGGANFISKGYINNTSTNQNTLYKMRWNPASPGTHQYATDISWSYNQVTNIKKIIEKCPNSLIHFDIPIFK